MNLATYLRKKWAEWKNKSLFSRLSDVLFLLLLVGLLIPASRKEIAAFVNKIMAGRPSLLPEDKQVTLSEDVWNWSVQQNDGQWIPLSAHRGKPIFLNFWATWCPPCIAEMPEIQLLYNDYASKVAFLLITDEAPKVVNAFMHRKGFSMKIHYHQYAVPEVFATNSIPTTWIIDPDGKIVLRKTGAAKWNSTTMRRMLDEMLNASGQ